MPAEDKIKLLIAEDQALMRFSLRCNLEAHADIEVIGESRDGVAVILDALANAPDVILMDIGLPRIDGIAASKHIKSALPGVRIIIFTASDDDEQIPRAFSAGADGYCIKGAGSDHLYAAIKAVSSGAAWLDPGIADKILRSGRLISAGLGASATAAQQQPTEALTRAEAEALELISQGVPVEGLADRFEMSVDAVANIINDTVAKLKSAASARQKAEAQPYIQPPIRTTLTDGYTIESVLGRGGMGIVYKGKHKLMDRVVAIKMLHPEHLEDDLVVQRFKSEAKSLSVLSHPNLVTIFDFGITEAAEPFLVMDYHNGKDLDDIIMGSPIMEVATAVKIFSQVCDALTAVHDHGMVHRDIKPSNIVISDSGLVKLVDFGIAKSIASRALNLTMSGEVLGTPTYMSPEQCMGKELDARSDIYGLGCVMYEVFTGRPPFAAESFYEMVRHHVDDPPPQLPFQQSSAKITPAIKAVVFRCLEKNPNDRFQSTAQLKEELRAIASNA